MKYAKLHLLKIAKSVIVKAINLTVDLDTKYNKRAFKKLIKSLYLLLMITGDAVRKLEVTL